MNSVDPIRDMDIVMDIADYLKDNNERDYLLWMIGIYTALRISDILKLRVRDVRKKDYVVIREKKTNKERRFVINKELRKAIDHYIVDKKDYEFLIRNTRQRLNKAISRQQAYNILREACEKFGVYHVGTHTMRKTFGYHLYQKTHDAAMLMKIFNHSNIHVTLRYIGVEQDKIDEEMINFSYK